jgi:hypothetical protein
MKLSLNLAVVLCLVAFVFVSCKKANTSDPIALTHTISGNVITLKWSPIDESSVTGYYITRTDSFFGEKTFTTNAKTTTLIDTLPPSPTISYSLVATGGGNRSNVVRITRSDVAFTDVTPYDALYDQVSQEIYVYSKDGKMQVYDVNTKKWVRSASWGSGIGYCDIGIYNGSKELYVPRSDGWLFIYDAATLTKTGQISVGTALYGVSYNHDVLYICGTAGNTSSISVLSYSRKYMSKVAQQDGGSDITRLKLVPGTHSEFFAISGHYLGNYKFDSLGNAVSQKYGTATGTYPVSSIFEAFPDGNKLISNNTGCIYNKNLDYETVLPHGFSAFTSFCFDNAGQLIYAGCKEKQIQAFFTNNYQLAKTVKTEGIPFKVFFNNGSVLCVSTAPVFNGAYYGALSSTTFVEQFSW